MTSFGYSLSSEEHAPRDLVANAVAAEEAGFDFASISDHFHPWVGAQGHSPFVWSVLGAIAASTEDLRVGIGVSCPTVRIHPAVIAQAAATTSLLFEGRFFLGVGTGEALNEHILGDRWPPAGRRRSMLEEAIAVMRGMWEGETFNHHGDHYDVENARLFDPPVEPIPIIVSGFGEAAVKLAADMGDGYWGHGSDPDPVERFEQAGGTGPRYAQIDVCWDQSEAAARATALDLWPNSAVPGQLAQDLPTWTHFEQASELVTEDVVAGSVLCGPDPGPVLEAVRAHVDAGYDHVYFHQVGPDQSGFLRFWQEELRPQLDLDLDLASVGGPA